MGAGFEAKDRGTRLVRDRAHTRDGGLTSKSNSWARTGGEWNSALRWSQRPSRLDVAGPS